MRNTCVLALALVCLAESVDAQGSGDTTFRALDTYLESELRHLRVPGAAFAVVRNDTLAHTMVFGRADESGRAITPETPFAIGSISKGMTAVAVMQLVDAGRIALDSPVASHLPWFHPDGGDGAPAVTVRHLLNQQSGIPSSTGRMDWASPDTGASALATHARHMATVKLAHAPGTTFEYANANYVLLGAIVEKVSGTSYETYIEQHLFAPLGMRRSFASMARAESSGLTRGYRWWFGWPVVTQKVSSVRGNLPAGELAASVTDVARYLAMHLATGQLADSVLASAAAMEELHRPAVRLNDRWSYAMGWMDGTMAGERVVWHNGLTPSSYAFVAFMPRRREGIVLLMNVGNVLGLPELNRAAFGALALTTGRAADDGSFCAMCPLFPLAAQGTASAVRAGATLMLVAECVWIALAVMRRRWRSRRQNGRALSAALVWAMFVYYALPMFTQTPPSVMSDVMPDLSAILNASVAIPLAWAIVRVVVRSDRFGRLSAAMQASWSRSSSGSVSLGRLRIDNQTPKGGVP